METYRLRPDLGVMSEQLPVPGTGLIPINAFVLHATEPVVVDTGLNATGEGFLDRLSTLIAPEDVRWIWLTHPDRDHTGGLFDLLEAAPQARVVTTFVGVGIMSTDRPLPLDRVHLLNPGQSLDVGDRRLTAIRPPLFDSPATVGFYDDRSKALFSSDCFGAPLPETTLEGCRDVHDIPLDVLREYQLLWATVDSPWVHTVDVSAYQKTIEPLRAMNPEVILSSHLPPATGRNAELFEMLTVAPGTTPFVGPDQQELEKMLASLEPGAGG